MSQQPQKLNTPTHRGEGVEGREVLCCSDILPSLEKLENQNLPSKKMKIENRLAD